MEQHLRELKRGLPQDVWLAAQDEALKHGLNVGSWVAEAIREKLARTIVRRAALADPQEVVRLIAEEYTLTVAQLLGKSRESYIVEARHAAMRELRRRGYSLERIGEIMQRDHKTVWYACKKGAAQ